MNKIYKLVWNAATGCWSVASEFARKGKSGSLATTVIAGIIITGPLAQAADQQSISLSCTGWQKSCQPEELKKDNNIIIDDKNASLSFYGYNDDFKDKNSLTNITMGNGNNTVDINGEITSSYISHLGNISSGDGTNKIHASSLSSVMDINTGNGDNEITLNEESSERDITLGNGNNSVDVGHLSTVNNLNLGTGNNKLTVSDEALIRTANFKDTSHSGNEVHLKNGGGVDYITFGDGDNAVYATNGGHTSSIITGNGNNTIY
ncbi:TPA: hypothetical protein IF633_005140, partial [Escherichia coli]|nr:hypothetical protein [Escherichia coli]